MTYIGYLYPCHNQLCSYLETEEELDGYDELADDSDDIQAATGISTESADYLLRSDNEMDLDLEEEREPLLSSHPDQHKDCERGPPILTASRAYYTSRSTKLASLPTRNLLTGLTFPLPALSQLLDVNDGRCFKAFQVNSLASKRNIIASFDTASFNCVTCHLPDRREESCPGPLSCRLCPRRPVLSGHGPYGW